MTGVIHEATVMKASDSLRDIASSGPLGAGSVQGGKSSLRPSRPVWVGSATFDERVGLSHTTGEITHHIDGNVDAERDRLFADLEQTGRLAEVWWVDDFHTVKSGKNGGGDKWHTDGRLEAGRIAAEPSE